MAKLNLMIDSNGTDGVHVHIEAAGLAVDLLNMLANGVDGVTRNVLSTVADVEEISTFEDGLMLMLMQAVKNGAKKAREDVAQRAGGGQ